MRGRNWRSPGEHNLTLAATPLRPQRGTLRKRRATASPEKFNTGRFDLPNIRTDIAINKQDSLSKRGRTGETNSVHCADIKDAGDTEGAAAGPGIDDHAREGSREAVRQYSVSSAPSSPSRVPTSRATNGAHGPTSLSANNNPPEREASRPFALIEAIVKDNALCIELVSYLSVPSLISLYAISKQFHWTFNRDATAYILANMRTRAPYADTIFPWRCYRSLCVKDPVKKQKDFALNDTSTGPADIDRLALPEMSRDVPSLRWLQMVVYRTAIVKDMTIKLATKSLLLPGATRKALLRMWFLFDLPLNAHRMSVLRNPNYVTTQTLGLVTHFLLKCEMAFTDPGYQLLPVFAAWQPLHWSRGAATGSKLVEMLLAEQSFSPLSRVLSGWTWQNDAWASRRPMDLDDVLALWARHREPMPSPPAVPHDILALTAMDTTPTVMYTVGREKISWTQNNSNTFAREQGYGPRSARLTGLGEMLMAECLRRELRQYKWWVNMMCWGFLGPKGALIRPKTEEEWLMLHKQAAKGLPRQGIGRTTRKREEEQKSDGKVNGGEAGAGTANEDSQTNGHGNGGGGTNDTQGGAEQTDAPPETPFTAQMLS